MTKGYDSDKDILKILDQATAEAKALRKDAQNGISEKVMVCDINRGMDDYVLSVQAVMSLMEKAKAEGGK